VRFFKKTQISFKNDETMRRTNHCRNLRKLCSSTTSSVSLVSLDASSAILIVLFFWFLHVVPYLWNLFVDENVISHTHTYRFEAPHSIFRKDPYVRNVDTDTKLFVMLGSLTHMIPFVLGLSSMSLLSRRHTNGEKICDQSFFLVSSFCTVLPFTFFLCTFAVLKMCFESQQGIIYELGHCFFTGSGGDAFAWMASSSVRDTCSLPSLTHSLTHVFSLSHTHTHTHSTPQCC